jgi:AcrR family transcriptional regulator
MDISQKSHTSQKILDEAEKLFATKGYDASSIRDITTNAGVNLAAIHYHFGSKEKLLEKLLKRKIKWLNEERLLALSLLEKKSSGKPLRPSDILDAFFGTLFDMFGDSKNGGDMFLRLLGRAALEQNSNLWSIVNLEDNNVMTKFKSALFTSLPDVPKIEIVWRFHFMIGATSHAISGTGISKIFDTAEIKPEKLSDSKCLLKKRLMPFLLAGLRAPLPLNSIDTFST